MRQPIRVNGLTAGSAMPPEETPHLGFFGQSQRKPSLYSIRCKISFWTSDVPS
jgi:hypothetical protein